MKIFGLIGEKLGHSLSPFIHNRIYEKLNISATYSLYQVQEENLKTAILGIKALDIRGVNVTIPYKIKIMEHLDRVSPEADRIGAINTILNNNGLLTGFNTDYIGFGRMLNKYGLAVENKTAVVLGTGGASKAVIAYLESAGASLIYNVTRIVKSTESIERSNVITYDQIEALDDFDILVNCTPVGMYPEMDHSPLSSALVSKTKAIVDLIYNPEETKLMQQSRHLGIPAYNGLYMLVAQAVAAAEIWNEVQIEENIVDHIFRDLASYIAK